MPESGDFLYVTVYAGSLSWEKSGSKHEITQIEIEDSGYVYAITVQPPFRYNEYIKSVKDILATLYPDEKVNTIMEQLRTNVTVLNVYSTMELGNVNFPTSVVWL